MRVPKAITSRCAHIALAMFLLLAILAGRAVHADGPTRLHTQRPNVVIILADDLGWGDPTCYNPQSKIPTPNIDRLASQGMRFTDAHTPASVCSPTRYSLLTGRFAWRTRLKRSVLGPYSAPLIEPGRLTLAKLLKQKGYATAGVGKWHLGMQWATRNKAKLPPLWDRDYDQTKIDLSGRITAGPLTAGFDTYFGTDVPNFPPYCFIENDHVLGPVPDRPKPDDMFGGPGLMQEGWDLHRILPALKDRAVAFIEGQARREPGGPFLLYMPLTSPHTPIVPNKAFLGRSQAGDYGDLVAEVDHVVAAVIEALKRTQTADNTLLIFTSDNGSPARAGDPYLRSREWNQIGSVTRLFGHNPNAPWRGMKSDAFEGGHRVPLLVRWPGQVPAGTTNGQLVCLVDVMATIAAILGEELADDAAEDSYNLLPTLRDPTQAIRSELVHHSGGGLFAIRQNHWKLIVGRGSGGFTKIETSEQDPPGQLYDLATDPGEQHNLYTDNPEIVQRLTSRLTEMQKNARTRPK